MTTKSVLKRPQGLRSGTSAPTLSSLATPLPIGQIHPSEQPSVTKYLPKPIRGTSN